MLKILNSRRSVRAFKQDPVSDKDIKEILEAAMNAPSAGDERAWQPFWSAETLKPKSMMDFMYMTAVQQLKIFFSPFTAKDWAVFGGMFFLKPCRKYRSC